MKAPSSDTNIKLGELMTEMVMHQAAEDIAKEERANSSPANNKKKEREGDGGERKEKDDDDDTLAAIREKRMAALKKKQNQIAEYQAKGHGSYTEIKEEEFLHVVTNSYRSAVHFYHPDFERSKVFDEHLRTISKTHLSVKIVKMNAAKAPFFTSKLNLRTLPTVVLFIDGVAVHYIVGFAELGGGDNFPTKRLVKLMKKHKVITEELSEYGEATRRDSDYESD